MSIKVNGVVAAVTTNNVGSSTEPGVPVVVTDVLPVTTTYSVVRWPESTRQKLTVQNQTAVVVEIGYGNTTSNPPLAVTATLQSGQEWIEYAGTNKSVWVRTQSGTGNAVAETILAGV